MQRRKRTKIRGLVSAAAFVFLIVASSVMAASPKIQEVFVDFGADTITVIGSGFTSDLKATLGTDRMPLTVVPPVTDSTMVFKLPAVADGDYLLALAPTTFSCDDGKPTSLVFEYTGLGCDTSMNDQGSKAACEFFMGPGPGAVDITFAGHRGKKSKKKSNKELSATPSSVMVLDQFTIEALNGGKLPSSSRFDISQGGELLQRVNVHTSCSQPLTVGDTFGSLKLVAAISEGAGAGASYDLTIEQSAGGGGPGAGVTFYTVKSGNFSATDGGLGRTFCEEIGDAATGGGYDLNFPGISLPVESRPIIVDGKSGWRVVMDPFPFNDVVGVGGTFQVYVVCADLTPGGS